MHCLLQLAHVLTPVSSLAKTVLQQRVGVKLHSLMAIFCIEPPIISKVLNVACGQGGFLEGSFAAVDETADSTNNAEEILVGAS